MKYMYMMKRSWHLIIFKQWNSTILRSLLVVYLRVPIPRRQWFMFYACTCIWISQWDNLKYLPVTQLSIIRLYQTHGCKASFDLSYYRCIFLIMKVDEALRYLGNFDRYQTVVFILLSIVGMWFPAWQIMAMVFTADQPAGYQCKTPSSLDSDSVNSYEANVSGSTTSEQNVSQTETAVAECFLNEMGNGSETANQTACTEWNYYMKYGEKTIVSDVSYYYYQIFFDALAQTRVLKPWVDSPSLQCGVPSPSHKSLLKT